MPRRDGIVGKIAGRVAGMAGGNWGAGVPRGSDLPRTISRAEFRDGEDDGAACGAARTPGRCGDDYFAGGEAEIFFERWVGAVFVWVGGRVKRRICHRDTEFTEKDRRTDWENGQQSGVSRGGLDAEREPADNLYFDAGGMRGGLPVLHDGAIGIDTEFDGGGDCWANFGGAERERRKR